MFFSIFSDRPYPEREWPSVFLAETFVVTSLDVMRNVWLEVIAQGALAELILDYYTCQGQASGNPEPMGLQRRWLADFLNAEQPHVVNSLLRLVKAAGSPEAVEALKTMVDMEKIDELAQNWNIKDHIGPLALAGLEPGQELPKELLWFAEKWYRPKQYFEKKYGSN